MTDKDKIACCLICSIAEVMKACQVCPFRIGLKIKAEQDKNTRVFPNQTIK